MAVVPDNGPATRDGVGTCHLLPPVPMQIGPGWVEAVFPETREDNCCADFDDTDGNDPDPGERSTVVKVDFRKDAA